MPARIIRASAAGPEEAGPIVAMILVRRNSRGLSRERGHYLLGMALHLHAAEHVLHPALAIDHEGGALDAPEAPPVEVLLLVGAVLAGDGGVLVGEEREVGVVLLEKT